MITKEDLEADLRNAIRSSDDVHKRTLRMALTAIKSIEVDRRGPLDEPTLLAVLQKEVKNHRESIEEAKQASRSDLVIATKAGIAILQEYLPQPLSPEELDSLARQAIDEVGASGLESLGNVMKALMPRVQGRADGKTVSNLARSLLSDL